MLLYRVYVIASHKQDERQVSYDLEICSSFSSISWMQLNNFICHMPQMWYKINLTVTDGHVFWRDIYPRWWYFSFVNRQILQWLRFLFSLITMNRKGIVKCSLSVQEHTHK